MNMHRIINLLIPTLRQALVSLALALSIQMLVFQSLVLPRAFGGNAYSPYLDAGKQLGLSQLNNFSIVRLGVQALFWAIVGLCAYVIYLGLVNAIVEARNEVVLSTEFANKGSFTKWIKSVWVQLALLAGLIVAIWITATVGIGFWFNLTGKLIVDGYSAIHALGAIGSILGMALNIYLLWILSEATVTADR